jgi:hypothetical protein
MYDRAHWREYGRDFADIWYGFSINGKVSKRYEKAR